ncbi:hypothetical protein V529_32160 [Bacillus velezensis SQR9]|nr:hypothetical protein V529_32160 [Bacillus velezensis SQR9]
MTVRPLSRQPLVNTRSFITVHGGHRPLLFQKFYKIPLHGLSEAVFGLDVFDC